MPEPISRLSDALLVLAELVLRGPLEAVPDAELAPALVLAGAAWNRSLQPAKFWDRQHFQSQIRRLQEQDPDCCAGLKSPDHEALVLELLAAKRTLFSVDRRSIVSLHFEPADQLNLIWEAEAIWRERRARERLTGQPSARGTLRHESAPIGGSARLAPRQRRGCR